jgi:hypothetical protein
MECQLLGLKIRIAFLARRTVSSSLIDLPKPHDHPLDVFASFTHVAPSMRAGSCWLVEAATFGRSAIANRLGPLRLLPFEGFRQHGAYGTRSMG